MISRRRNLWVAAALAATIALLAGACAADDSAQEAADAAMAEAGAARSDAAAAMSEAQGAGSAAAAGAADAAAAGAEAGAAGAAADAATAAADAASAEAGAAAADAAEAQAAAELALATAQGNEDAVAAAEAALADAQAAAEAAGAEAASARQEAAAAQADAEAAQADAEAAQAEAAAAQAEAAAAQQEAEAATSRAESAEREAEVAQAQVAVQAGDYTANIRPAEQPWVIGYGDGFAGIPFTDSVTDSINEVAEQMGVEILYCDNAVDQEKTVQCSNLIVDQNADGVIFANWIGGTQELIGGIFTDAGLPCVSYDGPHPGCIAFGPDNFESSREAGRYLAAFANEQGWDPAETELIVLWVPDVPVMPARRDGSIAGVTESFAIPAENIHVDIPHRDITDVLPNVTDWITANPDAKNVLCFGHSDQPGVDCALALEAGGFGDRAAAASLGASDEALVELCTRTDEESIFKATISFFPERYGQYLVPIVVDMLEGWPVPDDVIPSVSPVVRANVDELYPCA